MKTAEEIVKEISEWANSSHSYLSDGCQYAKGYKAGVAQAKDIVKRKLSNVTKCH